MLIAEVKRQGKPYGLYFDQVTGGYTTTASRGLQAFTVVPLVVYRVFADGRPDELIRGADIVGTPLASFEKIMATSDKMEVFNGICGAESGASRCPPSRPRCWFRKLRFSARNVRRIARPSYAPIHSYARGQRGSEMIITRVLAVSCLLGASATLLLPQKPDPAGDDVILRAMRDELERSRELRAVGGGDDSPYYFSYDLTDTNEFQVSAVLGSPITVSHVHFRSPQIDVRVGNYDFDDTGHIFSGRYSGERYDNSFPLDDNYLALRDALWLATDTAYKTAVQSMSRKRAALNASAAQTEKLPDFAHAEPVKSLPKVVRPKIDEAAWTARTVKLSSVFSPVSE